MWTTTALWLTGICSFTGGAAFFGLMAGRFFVFEDDETEKRGVWANRDRAYQLTPIRKPPVDPR
jgi:hypothetical protein